MGKLYNADETPASSCSHPLGTKAAGQLIFFSFHSSCLAALAPAIKNINTADQSSVRLTHIIAYSKLATVQCSILGCIYITWLKQPNFDFFLPCGTDQICSLLSMCKQWKSIRNLIFSDPIQASVICGNKSDINLTCVILTVIWGDRLDIFCQCKSHVTENTIVLHFNEENTRGKDSLCYLL